MKKGKKARGRVEWMRLTSRTYLNTTATSVCEFAGGAGPNSLQTKAYRVVPVSAIKRAMVELVRLFGDATPMAFSYVKGQYVTLYRLLHISMTEEQAQLAAETIRLTEVSQRHDRKPGAKEWLEQDESGYLEFCGVNELPEGWVVRMMGYVRPGDLIYDQGREAWRPAYRAHWNRSVNGVFAAFFDPEEIPR